MRYEILEEVTKVGRKKEKQYVLFDNVENSVVCRYATHRECEEVLIRWQNAVKNAPPLPGD